MYEQRRYEFILQAQQPIAHHSESSGNTSMSMRKKVRQPDGSFVSVPCVTGDTLRHGLREASTYALLDAAGLLDAPNLSEAACRLLFAGGMITGSAGGAVKLGDYAEMVDLIPPLALLGGCAQNRSIPGRLAVSYGDLICEEQEHLLPEWVVAWVKERSQVLSCRSHMEDVTRVRMDPMLDPGKRMLLGSGEASKVEQRLLASENASELGDHVEKDRAKSTLMPRNFERIAQGSLFYWHVTATCYSELDADTFVTMCAAFLANAHVGGKRATGHGHVIAVAGRDVTLLRPKDAATTIDTTALGARAGERFRTHVKERAQRIRDFLAQVEA